jgi:hypothetical protein
VAQLITGCAPLLNVAIPDEWVLASIVPQHPACRMERKQVFSPLARTDNRVLNGQHMLDATEIFRTLNRHKKESFIKLGFHLIMFFFYLYAMIVALIAGIRSGTSRSQQMKRNHNSGVWTM